jgi:hypothetical protein
MADAGTSATEIWQKTGWFKGADDGWRFEIPDKAAKWIRDPAYGAKSTDTMKDVLDHPELYKAYPHLADMPISKGLSRWSGMYTPPGIPGEVERIQINRADPSSPRSIVLHELQHAVQEHEGFDPGGMPSSTPELRKNYEPDDIYHMSAGETEARAVEARRDMTLKQLKAKPPWRSEDTPRSFQILQNGLFGSKF